MFGLVGNSVTILSYSLAIWIVSVLIFIATFYSEMTAEGPLQPDYDYIIVGAGTAGVVILSEMSPEESVLVVEAGPKPADFFDIPILAPILQRSPYDWSFLTTPQDHSCRAMNENRCRWPAGRGFGGSNILNNMIYYRGNTEDYRGWFKDANDYSFHRDILPLFVELERGLSLRQLQYRSRFGDAFDRFSATDSIARNTTFERPLVTQRNGFRWTMAHHAQLTLRPNHQLLLNAIALKLIFHPTKRTSVLGLEVTKNGLTYKIHAKKGIILTAGAIGTPKLLLLSGIGACDELRNLSIPCRLNLPGVGRNLQDHIATGLDLIMLNTSMGLTMFDLLRPKNVYDYFMNEGRAQWSMIGCESLGFAPSDERLPQIGFIAMPMGISSDSGVCLRYNFNLKEHVWAEYFRYLVGEQAVSIMPVLLHPKSRGYVKLASNNMDVPPIINPRYLSDPDDAKKLIEGIGYVKGFIKHRALRELGASIMPRSFPGCEMHTFDTYEYWLCYVRQMTLTVYHPGGTCRMGLANDTETVVRRGDFLVNGIDNLYVADASIMPNLPSGNPNAAVGLIAKEFMRKLTEQEDRRAEIQKKLGKAYPGKRWQSETYRPKKSKIEL